MHRVWPSDGYATDESHTLVEQHGALLHAIAQEETRCLELRAQLSVREGSLASLKQRWEDVVAARYPGRRRSSYLDSPPQKTKDAEVDARDTARDSEAASDAREGARAKERARPREQRTSASRTSSTSSSSSTDSNVGLREVRRWVRSFFASHAPAPITSSRAPSPAPHGDVDVESSDKPAAGPCMPRHRVSMPYASGLSCIDENGHRKTPSQMTVFAPEEEWNWKWYYVGK